MKRSKIRRLFANAVASLVQDRQFRHDIRAILTNGFFKSLGLIFDNKKKRDFPRFLSACVMVKNEPDLVEMIEFNKKAGIEKFYVYDNESTDDIKERLAPYIKSGVVEHIYFPGKAMQIAIYDDCIARAKYDTKWLAFIDADELILPLQNDLHQTLEKMPKDARVLILPWMCFGSSGHITRPQGGMVKNYLRRMPDDANMGYKTIANPRLLVQGNPHLGYGWGRIYDANLKKVRPDKTMKADLPMDRILVNHYWCRSKADFDKRAERGDAAFKADDPHLKTQFYLFEYRDRNEVFDDRAMKFLDS